MINGRSMFKVTSIFSIAAVVGMAAFPISAEEMMVTASGTFVGKSNHVTSGSVEVVEGFVTLTQMTK